MPDRLRPKVAQLRTYPNNPVLENTLHRQFHQRRVNRVNERKEIFRVSLPEIAEAVLANHGEIAFLHEAEAQEYRKTAALLADAI